MSEQTSSEQSGSQAVMTPWGRRPKFCPVCESELRWFGDWSAACACTALGRALVSQERTPEQPYSWIAPGVVVTRARVGVVEALPASAPLGSQLGPRSTVRVKWDDGTFGLAYVSDLSEGDRRS